MKHSTIYLGPFDWNFAALRPDTKTYNTREDVKKSAKEPDVDGFCFGYMQKGSDLFMLVRVDEFVLRNPVLVTERHQQGKGFGPEETQFGDDDAARYLVDAIVENPELRDSLGAKLRRLAPS